jgi:hypothetical protein
MSWATQHIARLAQGETVQFRPIGNSMTPRIHSGQLCTVEPVSPADLRVGDVVLCKVRGFQYLHLIKAVRGEEFLIGNNKGPVNGWTKAVYGRLLRVE